MTLWRPPPSRATLPLHQQWLLSEFAHVVDVFVALPTIFLRKSVRSTNKAERKRGKRGTVDEEGYILASIVKLVSRLETFRCPSLVRARALLNH